MEGDIKVPSIDINALKIKESIPSINLNVPKIDGEINIPKLILILQKLKGRLKFQV